MPTLGIIGGGYVGTATAFVAPPTWTVLIYDLDPQRRLPPDTTMEHIKSSDLIFVCVPTPTREGRCDVSIVQSVVDLLGDRDQVIIRSTVPPGTCDRLKVHMMPEFLTEANWKEDVLTRQRWVIGLHPQKNPDVIFQKLRHLLPDVDLWRTTPIEAEMIKYTTNCFLACKVAFFNEIYDFCLQKGIGYETIRQWVKTEPRIGGSHTQVPGPDGKRGFGGSCLPKDLAALIHEYPESPIILKAIHERNLKDREI